MIVVLTIGKRRAGMPSESGNIASAGHGAHNGNAERCPGDPSSHRLRDCGAALTCGTDRAAVVSLARVEGRAASPRRHRMARGWNTSRCAASTTRRGGLRITQIA